MERIYRVLVVDDDPIMLRSYSRLLKSAAYEVLQATTGEDGISLAKKEKPDLILLDVVLPDLDGLLVCKRLKEDPELAESFVVLLSSFRIASDDQAEGLEAGADDYIARPIANREFLARVQATLRIREAQQQMKSRERQQAAVAEVGRYALVEDNLALLRNQCASLAVDLLHVDCCGIYKPVHGGTALLLQAGVGWREGLLGQAHLEATPDSLTGLAFQASTPIIVKDISKDGRFRVDPLLADHDLKSSLAVPIGARGETFGVLAVYTSSLRNFTENDAHFLQSLANLLAAAILRKRAEAELLKAAKFEAIGLLARGIAHDFNNMLAVVLGNLNLMQLSTEPGSPFLNILSDAERAVLKASELSQRLLTFATGAAPLKEAVAVKDLLLEAVDFALKGSNVRSEYRFPEDPAWMGQIAVDKAQLHQALRNIVTNAMEAMPEGGLLRVTVEHATGGADELKARGPFASPDYVKISIQDHGRGIPKQDLGRIFDPYFSTKTRGVEKGMGLGLSLAYSIIRRHGGNLQAESEEGVGTVCHIYLPTAEKKEVEGKPPENRTAVRRGSILVMDDEKMFREMVVQLLKHLGFKEIELARDGREAIERFAMARQSGKPFDIVLLDLTIKGGMGGVETIKVLREMDPSVKAIICSGYSNDQVISDFRAYGFAGALTKPYLMKQLSDVLAEAGCA